MVRPCYLVVDREYAGSISTRKLVLETAKLNVITAYSAAEAIETLEAFPAVAGVVLDVSTPGMPCAELVQRLKELKPALRMIVVGRPGAWHCGEQADHYLESFDPKRLLDLIERLAPEVTAALLQHEDELAKNGE